MSAAATIALIDMALAAIEVATKANALIMKARTEGRDVTTEEFDQLVTDNDAKRSAWDKAKP